MVNLSLIMKSNVFKLKHDTKAVRSSYSLLTFSFFSSEDVKGFLSRHMWCTGILHVKCIWGSTWLLDFYGTSLNPLPNKKE